MGLPAEHELRAVGRNGDAQIGRLTLQRLRHRGGDVGGRRRRRAVEAGSRRFERDDFDAAADAVGAAGLLHRRSGRRAERASARVELRDRIRDPLVLRLRRGDRERVERRVRGDLRVAERARDQIAGGARVDVTQPVDLRVPHARLRLIDQRHERFRLRDVVGRSGQDDRLAGDARAHGAELVRDRARDVARRRFGDAHRLDGRRRDRRGRRLRRVHRGDQRLDLREIGGRRLDQQRRVGRARDARAAVELANARGHCGRIRGVQLHRVADRARRRADVDALHDRAHAGDVLRRCDDDERIRVRVDGDARARIKSMQYRSGALCGDDLDRQNGRCERHLRSTR